MRILSPPITATEASFASCQARTSVGIKPPVSKELGTDDGIKGMMQEFVLVFKRCHAWVVRVRGSGVAIL